MRTRETRIDLVLKRFAQFVRGGWAIYSDSAYIIAECKRANPSYCDWCFCKAPELTSDDLTTRSLILEQLAYSPKLGEFSSRIFTKHKIIVRHNLPFYQLGTEIKSLKDGNKHNTGEGKGAVELAASQVCTGLSGMINLLAAETDLWVSPDLSDPKPTPPVTLIPVIFTTANLWVSDANLAAADLASGNLSFENHNFQYAPWLLYQYNLSPGIKHSLPRRNTAASLSDILFSDFIRTIVVVNPSGLDEFLRFVSALEI